MNRRKFVQGVVGATAMSRSLLTFASPAEEPNKIAYYLDPLAGSAAAFPMQQIQRVCAEKSVTLRRVQAVGEVRTGHLLVIGCAGDEASPVHRMCMQLGAEMPRGAESFVVKQAVQGGVNVVLVCGNDPLGLAYALYSLADSIECGESIETALHTIASRSESPVVRDRSLSIYTMQQAYFEKRLYDEKYWDLYLNNLVRHRFNNLSLLFAYESTGYLAPPYPWFFDLPQFPEVKAAGVTPENQRQYVHALNRLVTMTHERGLKFTLGIWDHIYDGRSSYYTKGVWDHLAPVNGRRPLWPVEGLTDANLVAYTPRALERFIELVPHLDGIQFRMHGESGLNKVGLGKFWVSVFRVMAATSPKIRFDARSKEFPLDLAYTALDMGVDLRLTTKYWAEQVGMPFHAAHIQSFDQFGTRTSYFNLLHYPQRYHVQCRLWTGGSFRVLLWGEPEFARRFAESTRLYDGDGFEVTEPLSTKMASRPHTAPPLPVLNAPYRYYEYEFQRYWPFFFAFGRAGYGLPAQDTAWEKSFDVHFGHAAGSRMQRALELASGILPRIVSYCFPLSKFPTTRGWPERQRWEDLPVYAAAEPSDVAIFSSFTEETSLALNGGSTPKIRLSVTCEWFRQRAQEVLRTAKEAEDLAPKPLSKEMVCALTDLRILAHLAEYHERRIRAGLAYSLYGECGDLFALDEAIEHESEAIQAWRSVVDAAGDVYARDLAMGLQIEATPTHEGMDLSGHWADEIPKLEMGLEKLKAERDSFHPGWRFVASYVFDSSTAKPNEHVLPHTRMFSISVPDGRYGLECEIRQDYNKDDRPFGPMWLEANGSDRTPHFTAPSGQLTIQQLTTDVRDGRLNLLLGNESTGQAILTRVRIYRVENVLAHVPIRSFPENSGMEIRATVSGLQSVRKVEAVWIGSSGDQAVYPLREAAPFRYTAALPAELRAMDGSYFLRATDTTGGEFTCPAQGAAAPIPVRRTIKPIAPEFAHMPVQNARPGQALRVTAHIRSTHGLRSVTLRYRSVTQYQDYFQVEMRAKPQSDEFYAEVPGEHISAEWDFMYFFEIVDNQGNGWIRPDAEVETPYIVLKLDRNSA